jgi:hypothetical protein
VSTFNLYIFFLSNDECHLFFPQPIEYTKFKFGDSYFQWRSKSYRTLPGQDEAGPFRDMAHDRAGSQGTGDPTFVIMEKGSIGQQGEAGKKLQEAAGVENGIDQNAALPGAIVVKEDDAAAFEVSA